MEKKVMTNLLSLQNQKMEQMDHMIKDLVSIVLFARDSLVMVDHATEVDKKTADKYKEDKAMFVQVVKDIEARFLVKDPKEPLTEEPKKVEETIEKKEDKVEKK